MTVPAGGSQRCEPGEPYPPTGHPEDHAFTWAKGRVLDAFQIVFVAAGRGRFESEATGPREVAAGTALVLLPGVWHRYAPDPLVGWTEEWIELAGDVPRRLLQAGVIDPRLAVVEVERPLELKGLLDAILARLRHALASGHDPERAALGLQALAMVVTPPRPRDTRSSVAAAIARAERRLADSIERPLRMPALARELGMAYSYFRREFKRHTGLSPYQYLQQLRLDRARRMIANSSERWQDIAEQLGFASSFHLSAAFKKRHGVAPRHLRQQQRKS